jgi:hypothetical protein
MATFVKRNNLAIDAPEKKLASDGLLESFEGGSPPLSFPFLEREKKLAESFITTREPVRWCEFVLKLDDAEVTCVLLNDLMRSCENDF